MKKERYRAEIINCSHQTISIKVHKADFILHIKQCNLLKDFQIADPESEFHWKKKADLAFRKRVTNVRMLNY